MLLTLLLLGAFIDSLPPLPDLAASEFPEPEFWTEPMDRNFRIDAHAGQFSGLDAELVLDRLSIRGKFTKRNDWDTISVGDGSLDYTLSLPHIVIEPRLYASSFERDHVYRKINPVIGLSVLARPFIFGATFDHARWWIEDTAIDQTEAEAYVALERAPLLPQLTLGGIYADQGLKPSLSTSIHIGKLHLKLGSEIDDRFPCPDMEIAYTEPGLNISTNLRTGVVYRTLRTLFDNDLPVEYPSVLQAETLDLAASLRAAFRIREQEFQLGCSYKEWNYRLTIAEDLSITGVRDVQEFNVTAAMRNRFVSGSVVISNTIGFSYNAIDSAIAFMPGHAIIDTFLADIGALEIGTGITFMSERKGVTDDLPPCLLIGATAGVKLSNMKIYLAVENLTDNMSEKYDGYFLTGRKYGAGLELKKDL